MQTSDRLHALDAVRGFALLGGLALHAAQPFIAGLGWVTSETPSDTLAAVWFTIHMFRMPLFFLIAGFFGRMMLERRGSVAFIKDRSRRIVVPLVVGLPVVMLVTGAALVLGALVTGMDPRSLQPVEPPPSSADTGWLAGIHLMHLWFLYYLVIFYAAALILRTAFALVSTQLRRHAPVGQAAEGTLARAVDAAVRSALSGILGPVVLALPIAAYYVGLEHWSPWGGLPAPFAVVPDAGALIAYGSFFAFGWLMQRQPLLLTRIRQRWPLYAVLAGVTLILCRAIAGSTPEWGPYLAGEALLVYTVSYMTGAWCLTLAAIGAALRFLSGESRVRRYLADSSYWLYLMHLAVLFFFAQIFDAVAWHWSVEYALSVVGTLVILMTSYHWLVRFTFVGAILNGRRLPRRSAARTAQAGSERPAGQSRRLIRALPNNLGT